jgi:hypothetical protein
MFSHTDRPRILNLHRSAFGYAALWLILAVAVIVLARS